MIRGKKIVNMVSARIIAIHATVLVHAVIPVCTKDLTRDVGLWRGERCRGTLVPHAAAPDLTPAQLVPIQ